MARVSLKRHDVNEISRSLVVSCELFCEDLHGTGDPLCVKPARAAGGGGGDGLVEVSLSAFHLD